MKNCFESVNGGMNLLVPTNAFSEKALTEKLLLVFEGFGVSNRLIASFKAFSQVLEMFKPIFFAFLMMVSSTLIVA